MSLRYEDFAIMLALESNPFLPMTELAEKLGVTRITAKKRVDDLRSRGIIKQPIAIYNINKRNPFNVKQTILIVRSATICDNIFYVQRWVISRLRKKGF